MGKWRADHSIYKPRPLFGATRPAQKRPAKGGRTIANYVTETYCSGTSPAVSVLSQSCLPTLPTTSLPSAIQSHAVWDFGNSSHRSPHFVPEGMKSCSANAPIEASGASHSVSSIGKGKVHSHDNPLRVSCHDNLFPVGCSLEDAVTPDRNISCCPVFI